MTYHALLHPYRLLSTLRQLSVVYRWQCFSQLFFSAHACGWSKQYAWFIVLSCGCRYQSNCVSCLVSCTRRSRAVRNWWRQHVSINSMEWAVERQTISATRSCRIHISPLVRGLAICFHTRSRRIFQERIHMTWVKTARAQIFATPNRGNCLHSPPIQDAHFSYLSRYISEYLDKPDVRSLLGVRPNVTGNFTPCSDTVFEAFTRSQDVLRSSFEYVAEILERNVKVLIYVGTYDWICNWVGNERWTLAFEWSGHEDFVKQDLRDWKMDGKVAGKTRSAHGLTFATIDAAGHLVRCISSSPSCEVYTYLYILRCLMINPRNHSI
jgi:hypothetical protein